MIIQLHEKVHEPYVHRQEIKASETPMLISWRGQVYLYTGDEGRPWSRTSIYVRNRSFHLYPENNSANKYSSTLDKVNAALERIKGEAEEMSREIIILREKLFGEGV